jgi:hypothetical protein
VGHADKVPARLRSALLLSCGGYRSGSTYCYNLLGEYVERANTGRRIGYLEPWHVPQLSGMWSVVDAIGLAVGKSHNAPGTAEGAEAWPVLLADAGTDVRPICTVRDFRDVLHSFSRKFGEAPEDVLTSRRWRINLDNVRWWLARDALLVRYEELHAEPSAVLTRALSWAGVEVEERCVAAAAAAAAPEQAVGITGQLPAAAIDQRTLLHADHLATPAGGGWRSWTAARLERLRPMLDPVLTEFGYAW